MSQIGTCTRGNKHKFDLFCKIELGGISLVDNFDRALWASQSAFAVCFDGAQGKITAEASHSANLAQRFLVVASSVSSQGRGLAHNVDASRARSCRFCVLISKLRIEVNQLACHHKVSGDDIAVDSRKRRECAQRIFIKFFSGNASGNRRFVTIGSGVFIARTRCARTLGVTEVTSSALIATLITIETTIRTLTITTIVTIFSVAPRKTVAPIAAVRRIKTTRTTRGVPARV